VANTLFRKGLGLKHAVEGELLRDYHSSLVSKIRDSDYQHSAGRLTIHLAQEFGFCYGVDRAVDYAYQTRRRFPDKTVFLTGEIIHNPHVNSRLRDAGIRFLSDPNENIDSVTADDVVILPAFGITVAELSLLTDRSCTLVDTTCGSVLNVWKNVKKYARDGYTAVIHGKVKHEETQATASQAIAVDGGQYLIVLDREEVEIVCDFIRGHGDSNSFQKRFSNSVSRHFDPKRDLRRVGLANQTTMLMSESLAIAEMFRDAMIERYGDLLIDDHYRAFETICSATQDRQDAVQRLLDEQDFDFMIVIGGYNSSNTRNLARICAERVDTYHIADPKCLLSVEQLRHLPTTHKADVKNLGEVTSSGWLPTQGPINVGITAGASTPDIIVGEAIDRISDFSAASIFRS